MSLRILIVYNPSSGRQRFRSPWRLLSHKLPDFKTTFLNIKTEREHLAAALATHDRTAVIGGDGTVRTVIQVLAESSIAMPLAIIPRGSGNLVARSLHLPSSIGKAARLIRDGTTTPIDLGQTDSGEYFAGVGALGYLSDRVTMTPQRTKRALGFFAYIVALARRLRLPVYHFSVTVEGSALTESGHSVFVLNASNIFGMHSKNVSSMHDGLFELSVTKNKSLLSFPSLLRDFYFRKGPSRHFALAKGKKFDIRSEVSLPLLLDGETFPERKRVILTVLPEAQDIIVARRYSYSRR